MNTLFSIEELIVVSVDVTALEWINNALWYGLEQYPNIRIYDPPTHSSYTFSKASEILYPTIRDIFHLPQKQAVLITAHSGLYVYNMTLDEMVRYSEAEGLSSLFTTRMDYCPDTEEVWIGTLDGGLNIFDPNYVPQVIMEFSKAISLVTIPIACAVVLILYKKKKK